MENEKKSFLIFSNFIIKIIALATMTVDHIGWLLSSLIGYNFWLVIVCRLIGRIALPLFCFMIAEGMVHTKKPGNYFLRLGIMATVIASALAVAVYGLKMQDMWYEGNIFIDLLLGALAIFTLKRKEWYFKILAVIPIAISVLAFIVMGMEVSNNMLIHWFPFFLRPQYQFLSVGMIVLYYVAHLLKDLFIKQYSNNSGIPVEFLKGTTTEQFAYNLIAFGMTLIATLGYYLLTFVLPVAYVYWQPEMQNAALIAGAFILLYNGKRGYNAKWFQYGSYLYYPLHLLLIFGIGALVTL